MWNFKVTQDKKKLLILTQIGCFRTPPIVVQGHLSCHIQGYMGQKIADFDPNWAFPDCNLSLNLSMVLKLCSKLHVAWKRCPIVFQGHPSNFKVTWEKKITDFDLNWVYPDCNSSFNSLVDLKWCTKLNVVWKRCPIIFQGHPSIFKIIMAEKYTIWSQFE